ncbi:MAG TPA: hypothetical protein VFT50_03300 [Baekduia sp.]|nr:hypothetical protein [Baekduia sp.]
MSARSATARALYVGAPGTAAVLAAVAVGLLGGGGDVPRAEGERAAEHVGGDVALPVRGGGRVLIHLPAGWGVTGTRGGVLTLGSPRTCHTATVTGFVDHSGQPLVRRGLQILGYVAGREFDAQRLWRGTVAAGAGYALYDPALLLGVEVVRQRPRAIVVLVHGLPTHDRCAPRAAAAPRWELSRLLEDLRVVPRAGAPLRHAARFTA